MGAIGALFARWQQLAAATAIQQGSMAVGPEVWQSQMIVCCLPCVLQADRLPGTELSGGAAGSPPVRADSIWHRCSSEDCTCDSPQPLCKHRRRATVQAAGQAAGSASAPAPAAGQRRSAGAAGGSKVPVGEDGGEAHSHACLVRLPAVQHNITDNTATNNRAAAQYQDVFFYLSVYLHAPLPWVHMCRR